MVSCGLPSGETQESRSAHPSALDDPTLPLGSVWGRTDLASHSSWAEDLSPTWLILKLSLQVKELQHFQGQHLSWRKMGTLPL